MSLRVALVDDHQPFRERLRALLKRDPDIEIVAEASSGQGLLDLAPTTEMDVVCMDIRLPGLSGIEVTRRLLAIKPGVRVIGLSAYAEPHYVEAMLEAGAVGHFTKGGAGEALLFAIHTATPERPCFGADISVPPEVHDAAAMTPDTTASDTAASSLGPKEREILRRIGEGVASPQIALDLSMDPGMVDVYRRNIMRKLHLSNDAELSEYARAWSLGLDRDDPAL
jgi:two-component system NarL family response regulator